MQAIIFDMDGTMVRSEPLHFKAFSEIFALFKASWTYDEFINNYSGTGSYSIIAGVLKDRGVTDYNLEQLVERKKNIYQQLAETSEIEVINGLYEFMEQIKQQGVKYIIASGTNADNVRTVLKKIKLSDDFPEIVSGEDIKKAKPHPEIFLLAAQKLGALPNECMALEDAVAGVKASKAAGMYCVGFETTTTAERLKEAGADVVVADYFELMTI